MGYGTGTKVTVELMSRRHGGESSYYSYRCERGSDILVEVEFGGGFDAIREEAYDPRCEKCCQMSGDWDGSLVVRHARPCWKDEETRPGRNAS